MNGVPLVTAIPADANETAAERMRGLFDTHYGRLYRLARRLAPDADAALDLIQDTFLKAARAPLSIPHGPRDEEAWLVRVLVNIQRDQWRKSAVRRHHAETVKAPEAEHRGDAALLAHHVVWRALDSLAPRRRAVVVMRELEELDVKDIAALLGIRAVTVRWHLSRGRRELARILGADMAGTK